MCSYLLTLFPWPIINPLSPSTGECTIRSKLASDHNLKAFSLKRHKKFSFWPQFNNLIIFEKTQKSFRLLLHQYLIAFSLKRHKKFSFRLLLHQYLIASSLKRNRKTSFWPPYKYLIAVSLKKRNKNFAFICDTMRKQLGQKNRSLCLLKLPWTQRNSTSYCKILKF